MDKTQAMRILHDHLDICKQCRQGPFNMCPEGKKKMQETIDALGHSSLLTPRK